MKVKEFIESILKNVSSEKQLPDFHGENNELERAFKNADWSQIAAGLVKENCGPVNIPDTVDVLKTGSPDTEITGVVVTFLASAEVIQKAVEAGANFIITHEPTFYNHRDSTGWLENDKIYNYKKKLIEDNKIAIWRFHDFMHMFCPDGIVEGIVKSLGWDTFVKEYIPVCAVLEVEGFNFAGITAYIKDKLGADRLRFIGNPDMPVKRVGIMVGACSGMEQILFFKKHDVDLLICGEINEWEISEYVRDAVYMGEKMALIVTGHYESEKDGMKYFAEYLKEHIKGVPVNFIDSFSPFHQD